MFRISRQEMEFRQRPVDYKWSDTDKRGVKVPDRKYITESSSAFVNYGPTMKFLLDGFASSVAAPSLLRWVIYQRKAETVTKLQQGREKLTKEMGGKRYKIQTKTNNHIDSMFIDRRHNPRFDHGNILVITCEGNASFYENGVAATPLTAGYSVLMWNHPGFGESTGMPWPKEEMGAIDVVVQFALKHLGWDEVNIVLYGWSIGGFTATWAAMNYPRIRALIVDASFDNIVSLAGDMTPWALHWTLGMVAHTLRSYVNLPIGKQIAKFNGPVLLVRRTRDEIMAKGCKDSNDPRAMKRANRTNDLLKSLLISRYPKIFGSDIMGLLDQWLAATNEERKEIFQVHVVQRKECQKVLEEYAQRNQVDFDYFPMSIGENLDLVKRQQIALYLASKHLWDFDADHGTNLARRYFTLPRHPWVRRNKKSKKSGKSKKDRTTKTTTTTTTSRND